MYDGTGRLVSEIFVGDGGSVSFSVSDEFVWKDKRVIHTHPGEVGGTLSSGDVFHLTDADALSYEAVCKEGTYTLERMAELSAARRREFCNAVEDAEFEAQAIEADAVTAEFLARGTSLKAKSGARRSSRERPRGWMRCTRKTR